MIDIRAIDPIAYAGALVALWNNRAEATFPLDERLLIQQLRMESAPKACFGAFDAEGKLIGSTLVKRPTTAAPDGGRPRKGYLSYIVVDEDHGRRGVGSRLLGEAESWLSSRDTRSLSFGSDTYHFFPGLPLDGSPSTASLGAFLESNGFAFPDGPVEEDLIADLERLDLAELAKKAPLAPGYRFSLYDESLAESTASFLRAEFPGRWHSDTMEAIDAGMRSEDLGLVLDEAEQRVVGFSRIYDSKSPILGPGVYWRALLGRAPGALGPIGISEAARGKGLGLALLGHCVRELAARGVGKMVIDWTSLGAFYAKLGFGPWKAYRMCSKLLEASRASSSPE